MLFRHLLSIAILPFTVAVLVPVWIARRNAVARRSAGQLARLPCSCSVSRCSLLEALLLLSPSHAEWAVTFLVVNLIYIPLLEEPMMVARFGDDYHEYCRHVGRILPRLRAWQSSRS